MSFPRPCLARVKNPETSVWTGEKIGILRAAATRENDKPGIVQGQNRRYNMQDSIGENQNAGEVLPEAPNVSVRASPPDGLCRA